MTAQDDDKRLTMLLRVAGEDPSGDEHEFRAMIGAHDDETLDQAICRLANVELDEIRRLGTVRLRTDPEHLLLSTQAVPNGEILLLQRSSTVLSCAAPIEDQRDQLTNLHSRSAFESHLRHAIEHGGSHLCLHLIDLDGFKVVNDTLGHDKGDRLLEVVSKRLRSAIRDRDIVARLGGDEFAIIQLGEENPAGADRLGKRIVDMIGRPYVIDGHMINIGASVGVAVHDPKVPVTWERLVRNADLAMYRAKQNGKGCLCFFEDGMDIALKERRQTEIDLRQAIAYRQFEIFYQPQMRLADKRICGMEALLRWNHPTRGQLDPGKFIPLAEETGMIVPIGEWVLRRACQDAADWDNEITVAVNVSARQLTSANLCEAVEAALSHARLPPNRLEIEITETVLMNDKENALKILHRLRDIGVSISMDDFGTGYSSLSYLQSFPFNKLKIDRSFIGSLDNPKNNEIVTAISTLGKVLGMETIAEGVETTGQLEGIGRIGCNTAQGFLIALPTRIADLAEIMKALANPETSESAEVLGGPPQKLVSVGVENDLHQLVYFSRNAMFAYETNLRASVHELLEKSRRNNERANVTGALLFNNGYFAQVLEGSVAAIEETFERIQNDERHTEIILVSCEPVEERNFADWSMADITGPGMASALHDDAKGTPFDPSRFEGNGLVDHLSKLLTEEMQFASKAA